MAEQLSEGRGGPSVRFFEKWIEQPAKSKLAGVAVGEYRDFIEFFLPGDDKNRPTREVRDEDKRRFAKQWEAYRAGKEQVPDGTPIEQWPAVSRSTAEMLRRNQILTVEQLAELPDTYAGKIMDGYGLKRRAQKYLEELKPASEEAAVRTAAADAATSVETLARNAGRLEVAAGDEAHTADQLLVMATEAAQALKERTEAAVSHFDAEIAKLTEERDAARQRCDAAIKKLDDATTTLEAKLAAYRKAEAHARKKGEEDGGPGAEPAVIQKAPEQKLEPGGADIESTTERSRGGGDPEDDAFFENQGASA